MKKSSSLAWTASVVLTTFSFETVALAAGPSLEPECWKTAAEQGLLMKGTPEASNPGARQWNLVKIARFNQSNPKDSCVDQIFNKATDDAQKYWHFIGRKYSCDSGAPSNVEACENYTLSSRHIQTVTAIYRDIEGGKPYPRRGHDIHCKDTLQSSNSPPVLTEGASGNIKDASDAVTAVSEEAAKEDSCSSIPESQRRKNGENQLLLSATFWLSGTTCNMEMGKKFTFSFIHEATSGVDEALLPMLKDPQVDTDTDAYAVHGWEMWTHPVDSVGKQVEGLMQSVLPGYQCYNNYEQTKAVCGFLGDIPGILAGDLAQFSGAVWLTRTLTKWSLSLGGRWALQMLAKKFPKSAPFFEKVAKFAKNPKELEAELKAEALAKEETAKAEAFAKQAEARANQAGKEAAEKVGTRGSPNKYQAERKKAYDEAKEKSLAQQQAQREEQYEIWRRNNDMTHPEYRPSRERVNNADYLRNDVRARIAEEAQQAKEAAMATARAAGKSEENAKLIGESAYLKALSKPAKTLTRELKKAENEFNAATKELNQAHKKVDAARKEAAENARVEAARAEREAKQDAKAAANAAKKKGPTERQDPKLDDPADDANP